MRVLAIETASEACSVALFEGSDCIAHDHQVLGRGHAEALVPMIAALPDKGRADRILVSLGPGSFTGVRIGIAAARALGFAWGAEVLGYPTLALVAMHGKQPEPSAVTVCMHGGHGEWFVQNFSASGNPQSDARSLRPDQIATKDVHPILVGNRAKECSELFREERVVLDMLPDARKAHLLHETRLTRDPTPMYGRAPDAVPQNRKQNPSPQGEAKT
ncbi:MAG: tRNA (adenosine(37)-N6)-threonylcarbamoyltransferase complex dimerization subunit type 1 TsaB [Pseudomonadota bacterium]